MLPHSFSRLPTGHVLATFQARGDGYAPVGALVARGLRCHAGDRQRFDLALQSGGGARAAPGGDYERRHGHPALGPTAVFVHAFPGGLETGTECAVPVVIGKYWIQTVPAVPGLVVLDVGDPAAPIEVARRRGSWVLVVNIDHETGALSIDETFRDRGSDTPGVDFDRLQWPHGATGTAVVHGALFRK